VSQPRQSNFLDNISNKLNSAIWVQVSTDENLNSGLIMQAIVADIIPSTEENFPVFSVNKATAGGTVVSKHTIFITLLPFTFWLNNGPAA
jgi:hypothetical protein